MLAQNPGRSKITGLAIANGYAAVAGALIATSRANANQGMGIGMIVIVPAEQADAVQADLAARGEKSFVIGKVTKGEHEVTMTGGVFA